MTYVQFKAQYSKPQRCFKLYVVYLCGSFAISSYHKLALVCSWVTIYSVINTLNLSEKWESQVTTVVPPWASNLSNWHQGCRNIFVRHLQCKDMIRKEQHSVASVCICKRRSWCNIHVSLCIARTICCDYLLAARYCKLQQRLEFWCISLLKS